MSKLEDYIAVSLEFACNLRKMWASGDYTQRQELQNALFECGIIYNRQKDECRSTGDNEFITEIARLSGDFINFPTANNEKLMLTSVGAAERLSKYISESIVSRCRIKFNMNFCIFQMTSSNCIKNNLLRIIYDV